MIASFFQEKDLLVLRERRHRCLFQEDSKYSTLPLHRRCSFGRSVRHVGLVLVLLACLPTRQAFVPTHPIQLQHHQSSASSSYRTAVPTSVRTSLYQSGGGNDLFDTPEEDTRPSSSSPNFQNSKNENAEETRFLQGDALHRLRRRIYSLKSALQQARRTHDTALIQQWTAAILDAQSRDAEYMYARSTQQWQAAIRRGDSDQAARYAQSAHAARAALPQFQLAGLWVGKYDTSFQLVNITYEGDVLTAYKITGGAEGHVPRGEITFTVDLSPGDGPYAEHNAHTSSSSSSILEPIQLNEEATQQWGAQYLQRHVGRGQVAASGYRHAQFIEGQLILVHPYVSFVWLPTGHQVFFGRPSHDLIFQLLRETNEANAREHLERCYQETEFLQMEAAEGVEEPTSTTKGSFSIGSSIGCDGCFE